MVFRQEEETRIWPPDVQRDSVERYPYQRTLRALGAHLDELEASEVTVLEDAKGFTVRYLRGSDRAPVTGHFSSSRLHEESEAQQQQRAHLQWRERHPQGRYEDVLRALGYEFDQAEAYSILLTEAGSTLVASYQFLKPSSGYMVHKRMVALAPEQIEELLSEAYARRKPQRGLLNRLI